MLKLFFGFIFSAIFVLNASSQEHCQFKIDTIAVLEDLNLNGLIKEIEAKTFKIYKDRKQIPVAWKQQLDCLAGPFSIANPKENFSSSCTDPDSLPQRQLEFLMIRKNLMVMCYRKGQGGVGPIPMILICKFSGDHLTDLWVGTGIAGMRSKDDVLRYLKSGGVRNETLHDGYMFL